MRGTFSTLLVLALCCVAFAQPQNLSDFPVEWETNSATSEFHDCGPVVYDINQDGWDEILVTGKTTVTVFDHTGQMLYNSGTTWTAPVHSDTDYSTQYSFLGPVTIAHLTNDAAVWVVIGASRIEAYGRGQAQGNFWCENEWESQCPFAPMPGYSDPNKHAAGLCHHWYSKICGWKIVNNTVTSFVSDAMDGRLTTPAAGDIDGDGLDELAFSGTSSYGGHTQQCALDQYGQIVDSNNDGHGDAQIAQLRGSTFFLATEFDPSPGINNFVTDAGTSEYYYVDVTVTRPFYKLALSVPAIGDLDGDGINEVVVSFGDRAMAYSCANGIGQPPTEQWHYAYHDYWNDPTYVDAGSKQGSGSAWDFSVDDRYRSGPVLADIDHNGELDVLVNLSATGGNACIARTIAINGSSGTRTAKYQYECDGDFPNELATLGDIAVGDVLGTGIPCIVFNPPLVTGGGSDGDDFSFRTQGVYYSESENDRFQRMVWPIPYDLPDQTYQSLDVPNGRYTPAILPDPSNVSYSVYMNTEAQIVHERVDQYSLGFWSTGITANDLEHTRPNITAGDLNRDGYMDLITTKHSSAGYSALVALSTSIPMNRPELEWSGFRNSPEHKGLYAQPVSGLQPQTDMVWSGRIVIQDYYAIDVGQTLTIKPGTVVEMTPYAELYVYGQLTAEGTDQDSIYFQKISTTADGWEWIYVGNNAVGLFDRCVVTGGTFIYSQYATPLTVEHCRIGNMFIGISSTSATNRENLIIAHNLIHDCEWYGIRGNFSSGTIVANEITRCDRAGIYWPGDYYTGQLRNACFESNHVYDCATDPVAGIAGGAFENTTAMLRCNVFEDNGFNQILCDAQGNIIMNDGYLGREGRNELTADESSVWCGTCSYQSNPPQCICTASPSGFTPLLRLENSRPILSNGNNTFRFRDDGVFIHDDMNCNLPVINLTHNYYEADGQLEDPPAVGNTHFCPEAGFTDSNPATQDALCGQPMGMQGLTASQTLYREATEAEDESNFALASTNFAAVIDEYPESPEAFHAMRGLLRNLRAENTTTSACHAEMQTLSVDPALPQPIRDEARRQSVWALASGALYVEAREELQPMLAGANGAADSVWALTMAAMIDFSETSLTANTPAGAANVRERFARLDDALNRAMGRITNSELAAKKAAVVESKDLASAYPNPFNSTVNIRLNLPEAATVKLEIFNLLGQKVATLANLPLDVGSHVYRWDAAGNASGVYLYRLEAGAKVESHKLLLMK